MTNPTPQPASEPEEWRKGYLDNKDGSEEWHVVRGAEAIAVCWDETVLDAILAEHVQAARTRELEAVVATAREAYAWLAVTDTPHTTDGLRMLTAKLAAALQALEGTTNNV